ncbi:FAD-dependent monooxygenase [Microbispora catharanthi]|uniref:FAD-dependent oxidoreductase n=1 Tax=Microbispora catharanthi TaxID=1712871 RepID=A0A5N6BQV2_9ACTN|nr:FAD-dependent monooxygenase [Microbispora catharanthi]KAB8182819.1 FAD-dependent oxidoreductase [Microbispora catharanthi]
MPVAPQVVIIGGGLGGLCAAHGLRRAGIGVTVHERDPSPGHRPQGYRLHLDSRGAGALHQCLPPRLYELFTATAGLPSRRVTVVDERLRELHGVTFDGVSAGGDPATFSAPVDRMVLRQVLLAGLDGVVGYGAEFTHYEHEGERVRAWFADGGSVTGDVLVGADGIGSRVRGQLLPHARIKDLGTRCVYGRTLLGERVAGLLPPRIHEGFVSVRSSRAGLALGLVRPREDPAEAAARLWPGLRPQWPGDYVMWALTVDARELPGTDAERHGGPAARRRDRRLRTADDRLRLRRGARVRAGGDGEGRTSDQRNVPARANAPLERFRPERASPAGSPSARDLAPLRDLLHDTRGLPPGRGLRVDAMSRGVRADRVA